ncbi:unnamed protein product [Tetraodon nigroviridis]|uniref:(spotted green pufferfish) hypothetical protein n=1 Tax=Tetraodon nigroviridis TaxID=99883 RepID=Q4T4H1_TETNG|nr:unnamed protein product [Tetraodon nigroviridis]
MASSRRTPALFLFLFLTAASCSWAEEKDLPVSELLWRANKDVVRRPGGPLLIDDVALGENERNADGCTSRDCMWAKSSDGKVYVPYVVASHYCVTRTWVARATPRPCPWTARAACTTARSSTSCSTPSASTTNSVAPTGTLTSASCGRTSSQASTPSIHS